jgi:transcriptional regulator with XRE-family HTH domain
VQDIQALLDAAKAARNLPSDNQLAIALSVNRATVSAWRHSRALPDTVSAGKLADFTGLPLARVLGIIGEARAISRDEKAVWRRLATAAATLVIAFAALSFPPISTASERPSQTVDSASNRHYANWIARIRAAWRAFRNPAPRWAAV